MIYIIFTTMLYNVLLFLKYFYSIHIVLISNSIKIPL